ncbi:MFS transporter [Amycolatopsis nigrescens]|uniref:MFS transporter n=1 Tax=Amycolatopsis nigrescens TaxID=381445 RepID=UPI000375DD67|nr:MFS transporter [Amycolatopsis nigrescens]
MSEGDGPAPRLLVGYRALLSAPGSSRLASASLVSKLPINMFSVSTLLLLAPDYSYPAAGLAISTMLVANAVSSPLRGRLADRYPIPAVLGACLAGYLVGVAGLIAAVAAHLPLLLVVASVALLGLCFPPVSILVRSYWVEVAGKDSVTSVNSLESAFMDVTLITGPVLATWLSTSSSQFAPFVAASVLMALAVALMSTVPVAPRGSGASTGDWRGSLRSVPLRYLLGALFSFCLALSAIEVLLPIYAGQHDASEYSGWFLAGLSVGSIAGALVIGPRRSSPRLILPALLGLFGAGAVLLALAMSAGPVLVLIVCPLAGLAIGATFAHLYTSVWNAATPGYENETQGWATSCSTIGFAAGAAAGSAVADVTGAPAVLFFSPAVLAVAAGLVLAGTRYR